MGKAVVRKVSTTLDQWREAVDRDAPRPRAGVAHPKLRNQQYHIQSGSHSIIVTMLAVVPDDEEEREPESANVQVAPTQQRKARGCMGRCMDWLAEAGALRWLLLRHVGRRQVGCVGATGPAAGS